MSSTVFEAKTNKWVALSPHKVLETLGVRTPSKSKKETKRAVERLPDSSGLSDMMLAGQKPKLEEAAAVSPVARRAPRPVSAPFPATTTTTANEKKKADIATTPKAGTATSVKKPVFTADLHEEVKELRDQLANMSKKSAATESALHQSKQHHHRLTAQVKKLLQQNMNLEHQLVAAGEKVKKKKGKKKREEGDEEGDNSDVEEEETTPPPEEPTEENSDDMSLGRIEADDSAAKDEERQREMDRLQRERAIVRKALGFSESQRFETIIEIHSFEAMRTMFIEACEHLIEAQADAKAASGGLNRVGSMRRGSVAAGPADAGAVAVLKKQLNLVQADFRHAQNAADNNSMKLQKACSLFDRQMDQGLSIIPILLRSVKAIKDCLLGEPGVQQRAFNVVSLSSALDSLVETLRQYARNVGVINGQAEDALPPNFRADGHWNIAEKLDQLLNDCIAQKIRQLQKPNDETMLLQLYHEEMEAYRAKVRKSLQNLVEGEAQTSISWRPDDKPTFGLPHSHSTALDGIVGSPDNASDDDSIHRDEKLSPLAATTSHSGTEHHQYAQEGSSAPQPSHTILVAQAPRTLGEIRSQKLARKTAEHCVSHLPEVLQMLVEAVNIMSCTYLEMLFGRLNTNIIYGGSDQGFETLQEERRTLLFEKAADFPDFPTILDEGDLTVLANNREHALLLVEMGVLWEQALKGFRVKHCSNFIHLVRRSPPLLKMYFSSQKQFVKVGALAIGESSATAFAGVLEGIILSEHPTALHRSSATKDIYQTDKVQAPKQRVRRLLRVLNDLASLKNQRARLNWQGLLKAHKVMQLKNLVLTASETPEHVETVAQAFQSDVFQSFRQVWHSSCGTLKLTTEAVWVELLESLKGMDEEAKKAGINLDVFEAIGPTAVDALLTATKKIRDIPTEDYEFGTDHLRGLIESKLDTSADKVYVIHSMMGGKQHVPRRAVSPTPKRASSPQQQASPTKQRPKTAK